MPRWPTWTFGVAVLSIFALFARAMTTNNDNGRQDNGTAQWAIWDAKAGKELSFEQISRRYTRRTAGGIHLPIVRRESPPGLRRRASSVAVGLGDYVDVAYSVLVTIGRVTTPLILDTGSSDIWVMSDSCTSGCGKNVPLYPHATFKPDGLDARLFYGDSSSGTSAFGGIGQDTVNLAGLTLQGQYFAAINQTNTSISRTGSAGIFGLGFPVNSVIWSKVYAQSTAVTQASSKRREENLVPHHNVKYGNYNFPKFNFHSRFPSSWSDILSGAGITSVSPTGKHKLHRRQVSQAMINVLASFGTLGPFLPRLVVTSALSLPLFTVTLQRNTMDVGGNLGLLTIGEMPSNVTVDELTWVPVRNYSYAEGGVPAPPTSPNEVYPIAWEVLINDVYLDGVKLPRSNLSDPSIALSALVDTGNSLVRGPQDVVQYIYQTLSGSRSSSSSSSGQFKCNVPHTLAFSIGGKLFPIDPRDFASQVFVDDTTVCGPNLVPTDVPIVGGYLFSWSLGAPFLKSVLSVFHFGNVTYPSQDPPRMGFQSTVPINANELLQSAVASAAKLDNFPMLSAPAPSGTPTTDSNGVVTVPTSTPNRSPSAAASSPSFVYGESPISKLLWSCVYPVMLSVLIFLVQC